MSTAPTQFPSAHGALAPRNPDEPRELLEQERREEQINAPRLLKFLNKTLDSIASLDQAENLKIHNNMVRCVAYYDGRSDGRVENGEWIDNPPVPGEIQPKDNEYKKQIDKLLMEMCRGKIGYEVEPVDKSSAKKREAAQFAQRRLEVNQERIETEPFLQGENQSLLLKFWTLRYSFFDRNAQSEEKSVEHQVLKHLMGGSEITVCRTCGMKSEGQCQYCGDSETKQIEAPQAEGYNVTSRKVTKGRVVTVKPDATMIQMDLNARDIPSSSFLRWRIVMRRCEWEAMYPDQRIPSSDQSDESRWRTANQNKSSNAGDWGSSSDEGADQFEKIEGELVWLDPKVYQRYKNKEAEQLKGGSTLKQGAVLTEQFPVGLCVARVNKTILDLYPSNKNICWTMCVYGYREHALHGSGTLALLGPQDTITDINAQIIANQQYMAAAREFVRSGAIEGGKLPSIDQVGIINCGNEEVEDIMGWAYGRSQPSALSGDVYAFREAMRGSLQDAAGTSSLSMQGAADLKVLGTATGVEASRDQAVGRIIPNRKLQAHMGTEWAKQILQLEKENYDPDTFLHLAGKADEKGEIAFTERGVKAFFDSEISEFLIKPVQGSWVPTSPAQERANASDFGQLASQVGTLPNAPELLSLIAPKFNMDYDVNEWGADKQVAARRLEEYARVCEVISEGGYPPSPEMVGVVLTNCAEWARVNPQMDRHPAFMDFYQDWWQSDQGRTAEPLLRMVIQEVWRLHDQGTVKQAQDMSANQIAASAPQQVVQEEMKEEEMAQLAETEQARKGEQVQEALGQQMLKERDREHQTEMDLVKQEHQAALEPPPQTASQK